MANSTRFMGLSEDTLARIRRFRDDRDWAPFHNPKDLSISLSLEASELLELFQWSGCDTEVVHKREAMAEELADVLIYAALLSDRLGLSMDEIVNAKLDKNNERYPVDKVKGLTGDYERLKAEARAKAASQSLDHEAQTESQPATTTTIVPSMSKQPEWTVLTRFLPELKSDANVGEWYTRAGGERFLVNSRATAAFWQAVSLVEDPQAVLTLAREGVLKVTDDLDVSRLDARGIVALLTIVVREGRATTGRFERAVKSGLIERALTRLAALDR